MIQLFRAETGEPLAVMDGRLITEMRTAAVSAVAVDLLASPRAQVLAILGSGVQARSHLRALAGIRDFKEVRVWSRTPENAKKFAAETGALARASVEDTVSGADVVLTLTSSVEPILCGRWLKRAALWSAPSARSRPTAVNSTTMRCSAAWSSNREKLPKRSQAIFSTPGRRLPPR